MSQEKTTQDSSMKLDKKCNEYTINGLIGL